MRCGAFARFEKRSVDCDPEGFLSMIGEKKKDESLSFTTDHDLGDVVCLCALACNDARIFV